MSQPPPSPPSPSTSSPAAAAAGNFPILAISLLGILATTFLLLSYYVFVLKCCLIQRHVDGFLGRGLSRSRRYWRTRSLRLMAYATGFAAVENRGLDESAIQAIPTLRYRKGTGGLDEKASFHECAVCLNEFEEEERIRLLPNCLHTFHIDCIDAWLLTNANCPLCRSSIAASTPLPPENLMALAQRQDHPQESDQDVVIEIGDDGGNQQDTAAAATSFDAGADVNSPAKKAEQRTRRHHIHVSSMGDECIDATGGATIDELFHVQPIRRSFSMDSGDRQLRMAVQKVLQQKSPPLLVAVNAGESSSGGSGRFRRQFFSFGRNSRNAVLPVHFDL